MNRIYLPALLLLCILHVTPHAASEDIPFRFDGSTILRWNRIDPLSSSNLYGIIEGDIQDSFPVSHLSSIGLSPYATKHGDARLTAIGGAGSEFGDPLLNKLEDPSLPNRDHYTLLESSVKFPCFPIRLFNGYRYVDHYSDRFDTLWSQYQSQTGEEMEYDNLGVAHGISGGFTFNSGEFKASGFADRYGYWGATPFFFSPLYRRGTSYKQFVQTRLAQATYSARLAIDQYDRYYDHHHPESYTDWHIMAKANSPLSGSIYGSLDLTFDTRVNPRGHLGASMGDSLQHVRWLLRSAVYDNGRPETAVSFTWNPQRNIYLKGTGAWEYHPKKRHFTFLEIDKPVHYRTSDFHRRVGTLQAGYTLEGIVPMTVGGWYRYADREPWEIVESYPDSAVITYDSIASACRHYAGASAGARWSKGPYTAALHADGGIKLEDTPSRFNLPWRTYIEAGYGTAEGNWFYASVRYELRSRSTLSFFDGINRETIDMVTPSQNELSFNVKVPFLLPIGREHLQSRIWISVESIRLFSDQRQRNHPLGNLIGPRVSMAFDGVIR